eukprot:356570-Alexandrium_andersonii.AAC.1
MADLRSDAVSAPACEACAALGWAPWQLGTNKQREEAGLRVQQMAKIRRRVLLERHRHRKRDSEQAIDSCDPPAGS